MASECFWAALFSWLALVIAQDMQYEHLLPVHEIVQVNESGDWKIQIKWKDHFTNTSRPEKITYDVEIFYTEQMRLVHNETIEVKPHVTGIYHWSWTSPLPLQCTSHSVRLRYKDHGQTSNWTSFYILKGKDFSETSETQVYPKDHAARVGDSIEFCCILKTESIAGFKSPYFTNRISSRTYTTGPVLLNTPSESAGINIPCDGSGTTYFTGNAPDDHSLTCKTRDLSSVECHWMPGRHVGDAYPYEVHYSINGRECSDSIKNMCVLEGDINKGKTTWTLTAKNHLGEKNISDAADLKLRVHLGAPEFANAVSVNARNATLTWNWSNKLLNSFPMICQVELNDHIIEKTFDGFGLQSALLSDLQPFRNYTARVRCGSRDHFYEWGDWSNIISLTTEEDIPEAVDVWMQVLDRQTYIIWKHPTVEQSNGIIKGYELRVGSPSDATREPISKAPNESCHQLISGSSERDTSISISTRNSKYISPPSTIIIPSLGSDNDITSPISGYNSVFNVSWEPSPYSSCGYVVDWFPTYRAEMCAVNWTKTKVPYATVHLGLESGVKYTLSVYACTSGAPQLLERRSGYAKELPPSGTVQGLKADLQGSDVMLSWEDVPEEQQNGVILGYKVYYTARNTGDGNERSDTSVQETSERVCRLSNLRAGDYTFKVKAFTSAGEGPEITITRNVSLQAYILVISILTALATVAFIITLIALCSTKREWLKSKLYPDIPKPQLSERWLTKGSQLSLVIDKVLLLEKEMLMSKNPQASLQVVPLKIQKEPEDVELMPKDSSQKSSRYSKTASLIILDSSYTNVPNPGIQNPTYNLPLTEPAYAALGYRPQVQNPNSRVLQTCDSLPIQMDSDYQPQSSVTLHCPAVTYNTDTASDSTLISCPEYLLHNHCS
ncbi:leukemia inhibitory factor receptor-like [Astyanax mexicanus]|uniref:Leukemia inhibitory factor receptor-like n=1 Tax=Astyanax mexicanus TaxID=7994 RepID=A0A8T2L3A1_ASTMX|nr:leukemia inhibitory factor receptor-like [Astyanax mexicanus]